jgi:hypothetical protein
MLKRNKALRNSKKAESETKRRGFADFTELYNKVNVSGASRD